MPRAPGWGPRLLTDVLDGAKRPARFYSFCVRCPVSSTVVLSGQERVSLLPSILPVFVPPLKDCLPRGFQIPDAALGPGEVSRRCHGGVPERSQDRPLTVRD